MKRLWVYYRRFLRHRRQVLLGLLCIPLVACAELGLTLIIRGAIERLETAGDAAFLKGVFFLLLLVAAVRGIFRFYLRWWIVGVSRRFEVQLKQDLFDKLAGLSFAYHDRQRSGDVVSRLTADVESVRMLLGPGVMYVGNAVFLVPGSLIMLGVFSPRLMLVMIPPLLMVAYFMRALTPRMHRHSTAVQESLASISHRAQETFAGIRVVKGYGLEALRSESFDEVSRDNRGHQIDLARARGLTHALVNLGHQLAFVPILLFGGLALMDRSIATADLFTAIDLMQKVFWPVIALGFIAGLYPRALASAERIDKVLSESSDIVDPATPVPLAKVRGALSLRDVGFTYPGSKQAALEGINVELPAGATLGVVGPTGSGKSTLLNLFGRLYEPRGEIRLDGVNVRNLSLGTLRGAMAYVPQDGFLFSDTYRANVSLGADEELDDGRLATLVEHAALTDEVAAFPSGYEQLIGERGVTLSGGQRQRTCIARALAAEAPVLVLDDTLSAVDTQTEVRLIRSLREAGEGRTVVVSAHRLASVRDADLILVLEHGRSVALGTHEELLERSNWYRTTWERQALQGELEEL